MRMRDNEDDDRRGRQGQVTRSSDQRLRGQESEAIYNLAVAAMTVADA